jgi:hypothetical protein
VKKKEGPQKVPKASDKLTVTDAARTIGVTRQAIDRFILNRRVPATWVDHGSIGLWLLRRGDLDAYVANRRTAFSTLPEDYINTNDPPATAPDERYGG